LQVQRVDQRRQGRAVLSAHVELLRPHHCP
jgi:hypothetical protein